MHWKDSNRRSRGKNVSSKYFPTAHRFVIMSVKGGCCCSALTTPFTVEFEPPSIHFAGGLEAIEGGVGG